jgi:hypothetical protein
MEREAAATMGGESHAKSQEQSSKASQLAHSRYANTGNFPKSSIIELGRGEILTGVIQAIPTSSWP